MLMYTVHVYTGDVHWWHQEIPTSIASLRAFWACATLMQDRPLYVICAGSSQMQVLPVLWQPVGAILQHGWQPAVLHMGFKVLPHLLSKVSVTTAN